MNWITSESRCPRKIGHQKFYEFFKKHYRKAKWWGRPYIANDIKKELANQPEYIPKQKACKILGCSDTTLDKFIQAKLIKTRNAGSPSSSRKRLAISRDSLLEVIEACEEDLDCPPFSAATKPFARIRKRLQGRAQPPYQRREDFTIPQVAVLLKCSHSTVLRLIRAQALNGVRIRPHRWRIKAKSVHWFIQSITTKASS